MRYQNVLEMRFLVNVFDGHFVFFKPPPILSHRKFPLSTSRSLTITRLNKRYVLRAALNTTN